MQRMNALSFGTSKRCYASNPKELFGWKAQTHQRLYEFDPLLLHKSSSGGHSPPQLCLPVH